MLNDVIARDREQTAKDFDGKLESGVDYVLDLNDFVKGENGTKSKGNLAKFNLVGGKLKVTDKMWNSLTNKDTVQVIGDLDAVKAKLEKTDHKKSAEWHLNNIMDILDKTEANVVGKGFVNDKSATLSADKKQIIDSVTKLFNSANKPMQELMRRTALEVAKTANKEAELESVCAEVIMDC